MVSVQNVIQDLDVLRNIFENSVGSFFCTSKNSTILYANKRFQQKKGYDLAQLIGKRPGDLWGGNMSEEFYHEFWEKIGKQKQVYNGSLNNRDQNGNLVSEEVFIVPVVNNDQEVSYFLELNPLFQNKSSLNQFRENFLEFGEDTKNKSVTEIITVLEWFGVEQSIVSQAQSIVENNFDEDFSFLDLLEQTFVIPTQQLFIERQRDQELIYLAQSHQENFSFLYNKYYRNVELYFLKRISDSEIAANLTQETFLRAYKNISSFKISNASYQTYLIRVAHNLLVNYYRKKKDVILESDILEYVQVSNITKKLDEEFIWRVVELLPKSDKDVVIKKYRLGMKIKEIAKIYKKSENAIKLKLSRARKKLARLLK